MDQSNRDEETTNQMSIQSLLDDLCRSIYKDVNIPNERVTQRLFQPSGQQKYDNIPEEVLKRCKKSAFEILLKKSNVKSLSASRSSLDEGYSDAFDPVRELQFNQFEYSIFVGEVRPHFGPYGFIKERQEKKILAKYDLFKECVQFIDGNEYFCDEQGDGYSILWFLTLLKNNSNVDTLLTVEPFFSLALDQVPSFPVLQPTFFKLNWQPNAELSQNPYCGAMQKLNRRSNLFHLPALSNGKAKALNMTMQKSFVEEVLEDVKNRIRPSNIYYESNRWEHHGLCIPLNKDTDPAVIASLYEKSFMSERSDAPLNLLAIEAAKRGERFQARIIDRNLFNEHIKLLLIGIESESFMYDAENETFNLLENLTIENVIPATIAHFVLTFIECGICYKRLKALIHSNNFQLKYNGFVFKALCSSLDRYLETFRSAIIIDKEETLGGLSVRVTPLVKQVRILARLLAVHPDAEPARAISYGSEFLGYLYNEITRMIQPDVYALLVFILSQCCDVYFRRFSNWIYHGIIEDPGQELFIEFLNYYLPKTKSFFDKAFVVKQSSVPGFLRGWQQTILLCGKYSNLLKLYNPTHPLFAVTPPQLTVCLSFAQINAVRAECHKYQALAQTKCGRSFKVENVFNQRQQKQQELVKAIAERTQYNLEQWKLEQEKKANLRQEKHDRDRLELLRQIEEIRAEKLRKRREEVEADREFLRQRELHELKLIERENEQRRKNIEHYTELTQIVDAQQKRADIEIEALKSKLAGNCDEVVDTSESTETPKESEQPAESEVVEDTLVNVEETEKSTSEDSDTESVYFDADKSPTSISSGKFQSPEVIQSDAINAPEQYQIPANIPRSASDMVNSNIADDLTADRARNRANVLNSNIKLDGCTEDVARVQTPTGPLTDAQKNKLRMLQQEYGLIDANANAETVTVNTVPLEMTDLQKNRNKVLSSEFGITGAVVNMSTETQNDTDFDRNKKMAQGHSHTFEQMDEINANANVNPNKPLTDLQRNRQKVMIQEYGLKIDSHSTNEEKSLRNKLKSSLSLDLDNGKSNKSSLLSPKACQSDFVVSPMSTTSDELMATSVNESNGDQSLTKTAEEKNDLRLDCSGHKRINNEQFTSDINGYPTPHSALNTAGLERNNDGFSFNVPYKSQLAFSEILRPSSTSSSIFDISPRLNAAKNVKATPPSPVHQPSKTLSQRELRDLNAGTLAIFLEQSFTIPLQVYSNILNSEILKIFFQDLDILSHFVSLRNYFFMMDGEFASNICGGMLSKLKMAKKPTDLLNSYALHSILESALQSSISGNDKNAENLSFCIPNIPEKFDISSLEVLNEIHLSYKVDWPLNLLITAEAVEHYNKVFQHLLTLRRITWMLDESLYKLKDIRKQSAEKIQTSSQFRDVQQIRHKLLCFVNALQNHITSNAIEGSWQQFQDDLGTVRSMEDLYKKHTKYLKRVMFLCMLNRSCQEFYAKMEDIFVVIMRFCNKLQSKSWKCDSNGEYTHPNYAKLKKVEEDFTNLIKFIIYAGKKMAQCGYQTEIGEFVYMININGFYD